MPIRTLEPERRSLKSETLSVKFDKKIIGQDEAKEAFVDLVDLIASGMYDKTKPIASLLFLGPTGTGKTGSVEAFVEGMFGDVTRMIKIDCGEFQHSHEIAKLIGSPPGYLGHRETHPFFTNAALIAARADRESREIQPFTVVLFDEIEKASDSLWALLLGILDKGVLTTGINEIVDFKKTVIVLTSNVGTGELAADSTLGFIAGEKIVDDTKMKAVATAAARRKFSPEFLNRIDRIIAFKNLSETDLMSVRSLMLDKVQDRITLSSPETFEFRVTESGLTQLLKDGYDPRYNARHLSRAIETSITKPLTRLVATKQVMHHDIVICDYRDAKWAYYAVPRSNGSSKSAVAGSL